MTRTEAATAAPAVRPRQRAICCRPNTRGKGQLSFRNEARRKARQPEVQQLLLLGGGRGTAGPACSSHAPNTPAQLPLMGYQQWLMAEESHSCLGWAISNYKKFQNHRGSVSRGTHYLGHSVLPLQILLDWWSLSEAEATPAPLPHTLKSISICDFPAHPALHTFPFRCYPSSPLLGVVSSHTASTLVPD